MDNLITIFLNLILIISGLGVFVHLVELVGRDKNKNIGSLIKISVFFLIIFILVSLIKIYFFSNY